MVKFVVSCNESLCSDGGRAGKTGVVLRQCYMDSAKHCTHQGALVCPNSPDIFLSFAFIKVPTDTNPHPSITSMQCWHYCCKEEYHVFSPLHMKPVTCCDYQMDTVLYRLILAASVSISYMATANNLATTPGGLPCWCAAGL